MTLLPANGPGRLWPTAPGLYLPQPAGDPVVHWTRRPGWCCEVDGRPWPCTAARGELRQVYVSPAKLASEMERLLELAARDLTGVTPAELHTRFVAWTLPNQGPFPARRPSPPE